ncbi:MAG: hypothetical protein EOP84_09815, partial [Verrucomicrobiaceae bacterium]
MPRCSVFGFSPFRVLGVVSVLVVSFVDAAAVNDDSSRDPLNPSTTPSSAVEPETPYTLPEVVVTETALRTEEDIWSIPQSISIVDRAEIERMQARTPT